MFDSLNALCGFEKVAMSEETYKQSTATRLMLNFKHLYFLLCGLLESETCQWGITLVATFAFRGTNVNRHGG